MAICSMPKVESFPQLSHEDFDYLNAEKSLTRKMYIMKDMLSLTSSEHCERERIVSEIYHFLRPYYPECDILVFGSSANGFGFKDCDLDLLFLPFPEYCNSDFKDKGSGVVPAPYHVLSDVAVRKKLYEMDEEMHLKFVQRVMYTTRRYFKKVFFIPAKCPILNIEFVFSPLHCDFSASNRLVLYNTQLLWVYGKLDVRVKPLVMFLRFWAKCLGFISKSLLSSYCLSLLVIFYLQNTQPAILPSVKYLNELAGYSRIIDGWETAICLDADYINANRFENSKFPGELLMQFFDFYWNFDFVQNIVSIYEGEPLSTKLVKESQDERIKTFQVTPFSVQDPFILSRNVSRNSTMKTPFKLSLVIAKQLLQKGNFDFELLFDSSYYEDKMRAMFAPVRGNLTPKSIFVTVRLTYDIHNKLKLSSQLTPWFDKVGHSVLDILQYGLLVDCEVIDKADDEIEIIEPPAKKRKFDIRSVGDLKLIMSIQCVVNFPTVWRQSRIDVLKHLKKTDASFDVEDSGVEIPPGLRTDYRVSKELCEEGIKDVVKLPTFICKPPYFSFICNCFHYPGSQLSDVVIAFSPLTNDKYFHTTKDFVKSFVLKHLKRVLEEPEVKQEPLDNTEIKQEPLDNTVIKQEL